MEQERVVVASTEKRARLSRLAAAEKGMGWRRKLRAAGNGGRAGGGSRVEREGFWVGPVEGGWPWRREGGAETVAQRRTRSRSMLGLRLTYLYRSPSARHPPPLFTCA